MRLFLLIILAFGHVSAFSQGVSKSGSDDLYLYKAKVLYKDGNGFIADVQKNFDSISVLIENDAIFLQVIRDIQIGTVNSKQQRTTKDTIIRRVSRFQIDTVSYGKIKEYTKQGQRLQGSSLAYFLEQDHGLAVGEILYFNSYGFRSSNSIAEIFGIPVLTINRDFSLGDGLSDEDDEFREEISIRNWSYKLLFLSIVP